jgi:hypothetical protein
MAMAAAAQGSQVCDLSFSECPRALAGRVLKVPPEFIRLDARIPACPEYVRVSKGGSPPPSIVFIIDNSGSMDENDPQSARFDVVASLLDDIRAAEPSAEVGLVVFTRRLSFDHRDNPFFKTAFPGDTSQHDSFVPLTPLDKAFPNGRTGLDTLKSLLGHDARGNLVYGTRLPASRANPVMNRSDLRNGTDISLGFMAAKVAMRESKADPEGRFFVFLSDGTPSTPDYGRDGPAIVDEFIAGAGVPTTFTVFFDTQNSVPVAPATIVQMTANIRANGYSRENAQSGYWAVNQPGTQLERVLRDNVVGNVLSVPAKPEGLSLAAEDSTFRAAAQDGGSFVFARRFNLRADTTRIALDYAYSYVDSLDGRPVAKAETVPYVFTIVRAPGPAPAGLSAACREQPQVGLFRDGRPVSAVTVDDAQLEARLIPPPGWECPACRLEVSAVGRSPDRESLPLAPAGGYWSAVLRREENAHPVPGDGRLQNTPFDSIVVAFTDPGNPLDQVRRAYPYVGAPTRLEISHAPGLARPPARPADPLAPPFVLSAAPGFRPAPRGPADRWRLGLPLPEESARYAGLAIEASRTFAVDVRVFSSLGEAVDRIGFSVPQSEFEKLAPGPSGHSRILRLFWDGRSRNGSPAATGAYIVKTTVRLLPVPGIAEGEEEKTEVVRVGVLRSR